MIDDDGRREEDMMIIINIIFFFYYYLLLCISLFLLEELEWQARYAIASDPQIRLHHGAQKTAI